MKKVLIISPGYVPVMDNKGGAIENLLKLYLLHNSKTNNFKITVYSAKNRNTESDLETTIKNTEFRVIDISKNKGKYIHKASRLCNILFGTSCARNYIKEVVEDIEKKNELNAYDLIIVENCEHDLVYIGKHFKKARAPIVLHLHNDYLSKKRVDAKRATKYLSQVWCVSDYLRNRVNAISPKVDKAITIYNAIDMDIFNKTLSCKEKENIRSQLDFKKDDFVFIYVGRIMKTKGVLPLVKAFNKFSADKDNVKLLIIGGKKNPNIKDGYYDNFKRAIKCNDKIKYLGNVDNKVLYKYYQLANCQLIPSKGEEAFGLVALEGKASNLKIISTGSGGLKEVLSKNDTIIEDLNPGTIKKAMGDAMKSTKNHKIDKGHNFSKEKFTSEIDQQINFCINRKQAEKKIILHVFYSLNNGGTEKYFINLLRSTNDNCCNLVLKYGGANHWKKELSEMDVMVFDSGQKNFAKMKKIYNIIKEYGVDVVYSYTHLNSIFVLLPAWLGGVRKRIVHSHVSGTDKKKNFVKNFISRVGIELFSTDRLACSNGAGRFLFLRKNFKIIQNGIDIDEYAINNASRKAMRRKIGISQKDIVIGTVGRLDKNKNQKFLLDILAEYLKFNKSAKAIIAGDGSEKFNLKKYAKKIGVEDRVVFVGDVKNVKEYYDAFDVFVLPSYREGLPYVLIEAQANGLPVLASNTIDRNAKINKNFKFLSLDAGARVWSKEISKINYRVMPDSKIIKYDASSTAKIVRSIYEKNK